MKDEGIDLVIADPPYGLEKNHGNSSDMKSSEELVEWTMKWIDLPHPGIKKSGSIHIFTTWRNSPEMFSSVKRKMIMVDEIIRDRKVSSTGGSTRWFSSVHDTIGYLAKTRGYHFDIDPVRIPHDPQTKKAGTRSRFKGSKWLEPGHDPKDAWSVSRLHRLHGEREDHPTRKPLEIIERMIRASCPPDGTVLDPLAGSGTIIEACVGNRIFCPAHEINRDDCSDIEWRIVRNTRCTQPTFAIMES